MLNGKIEAEPAITHRRPGVGSALETVIDKIAALKPLLNVSAQIFRAIH